MSNQNQTPSLHAILPYGTGVHFPNRAIQKIFQKMSSSEYVLMWLLFKHAQDTGSDKIYLKDLAQNLNLPMGQVSKIARDLPGRGSSYGPTTETARRAPTSSSPTTLGTPPWPSRRCSPTSTNGS